LLNIISYDTVNVAAVRASRVRCERLLGGYKFATPIIGGFRDKRRITPASDGVIIFNFSKFAKTTTCHYYLLSVEQSAQR